jgi:hypothetical protein
MLFGLRSTRYHLSVAKRCLIGCCFLAAKTTTYLNQCSHIWKVDGACSALSILTGAAASLVGCQQGGGALLLLLLLLLLSSGGGSFTNF